MRRLLLLLASQAFCRICCHLCCYFPGCPEEVPGGWPAPWPRGDTVAGRERRQRRRCGQVYQVIIRMMTSPPHLSISTMSRHPLVDPDIHVMICCYARVFNVVSLFFNFYAGQCPCNAPLSPYYIKLFISPSICLICTSVPLQPEAYMMHTRFLRRCYCRLKMSPHWEAGAAEATAQLTSLVRGIMVPSNPSPDAPFLDHSGAGKANQDVKGQSRSRDDVHRSSSGQPTP